jgi:predicted nucleic acid-binding protein
MMRAAPAPAVLSWMNGQDVSRLFLTAVTVGEIRYGLRILELVSLGSLVWGGLPDTPLGS